jgi:NADH:ubiquinone oxidoreductase subunit C
MVRRTMDTERAIDSAEILLRQWAVQIDAVAPWRLDVLLPHTDLTAAAHILCGTEWGTLTSITALDLDLEGCQLELIYDFRCERALVCLRLRLPHRNGPVPSLTPICSSARPFEESLSERFGIRFE